MGTKKDSGIDRKHKAILFFQVARIFYKPKNWCEPQFSKLSSPKISLVLIFVACFYVGTTVTLLYLFMSLCRLVLKNSSIIGSTLKPFLRERPL